MRRTSADLPPLPISEWQHRRAFAAMRLAQQRGKIVWLSSQNPLEQLLKPRRAVFIALTFRLFANR